jgi:hypothetical protein
VQSSHWWARRLVPWCARPDVVPFAPGASASQNVAGIGARKRPQHPPEREPGCQ